MFFGFLRVNPTPIPQRGGVFALKLILDFAYGIKK